MIQGRQSKAVAVFLTLLNAQAGAASASHTELLRGVDSHAAAYAQLSRVIWEHPELGYHETVSSGLLQKALQQAGFTLQTGVAGEPTAFVASYGQGSPVIGILGEFDALPGLSQDSTPGRRPLSTGAPGHGCGHNLLGAGAALAAVALRDHMERHHLKGTLRYYGTPAEEGGGGKVYLLRAGLFKDVDAVLHWHPSDRNAVQNGGMLAFVSARLTFHGVAAHAASAPERGRSALDAVMLTGTAVEYLREHVPSNTRIHYVITKGGTAANVVPDLAELSIMARSPWQPALDAVWGRVQKIAEGAALMTETRFDLQIISSTANILSNDVLAQLAQRNLEQVGGYRYTEEETRFAQALQRSLPAQAAGQLTRPASIDPLMPFDPNIPAASTDVGDISWNVPTIGVITATFVPGVAAHTWQAAASAGMSIGQKGMVVAAKALALTGADLFADPQLLQRAHEELLRHLKDQPYRSLTPPDQKPPLDYAQ